MSNMYDLLKKIQKNPGMYIGYPSVSNLFMFLCGYEIAYQELNIPISAQEEEFNEFQTWLQKKFNLSTSASWARIILLYSIDERDGFDRFFELFDEFLNRHNYLLETEEKLELATHQ